MATDVRNQRMRYGGFNTGAAFYGWLVATGVGVLITALLTAFGGVVALSQAPLTADGHLSSVGFISGILLLVDVAIAYYAGGYVAGRLSRFDGGRQGFGTWVMGVIATIILALAGAVFGAAYNLLQQINLPHIPVSQGALTAGGVITLALVLVVSLLAALIGGKVGEQYHRRVDAAGRVPDAEPSEEERYAPLRTQPTFGERLSRRESRRSRDRR